jgi:hypothetical protein
MIESTTEDSGGGVASVMETAVSDAFVAEKPLPDMEVGVGLSGLCGNHGEHRGTSQPPVDP